MIYIDPEKLRCPECGAPMGRTVAMDMGISETWFRCSKDHCHTYINTFIPMPHQVAAMTDSSRYLMVAGGYGTGKTRGDIEDRIKGAIITPNGRTLLGAPTMPQLNSTLRNDLEQILPIDFIKHRNLQQNTFSILNDHEVLYRSFDDPNKLKSLNLSAAILVEASDSPYTALEQLKTRLRNRAATLQRRHPETGELLFKRDKENKLIPVLQADWRKIIMETNPGPGWIKDEVLLKSNKIHYFYPEETYVEYFQDRREIDINMSSYIVPTKANIYLPPSYEEEQSAGKPKWWVERYFKGSFSYATGLVYPTFQENLVAPFKIPNTWKRLIAMDFGIRDQTFFVFLAVDPDNHIAYVYDSLIMTDSSIHTIADAYREKLKHFPVNSLMRTPVMDQRSRRRRMEFNVQKTIGDLFADEGLLFDDAQMNVEARITRTGTLFNKGQLKIFSDQMELIKQLTEYKFPELQVGKHVANADKPQASEDHGPNALEFAVMELPHNLENINYDLYNIGNVGQLYTTKPKTVQDYFDPFSSGERNYDYDFNQIGGIGNDNYYNDGDSGIIADFNSLHDSNKWD